MKKHFKISAVAVAAIMIIGGIAFVSCNKESDKENMVNTSIETKKASREALISALAAVGINVETGKTYIVTYKTGSFYEESVLWGLYRKTGCNPSDNVCELISVMRDGVSVEFAVAPNEGAGGFGLNVHDPVEGMFDGLINIGGTLEEPRLFFMVDITKVTNPSLYEGDYIKIDSPFAIDYELAINASILPEDQIIPSGEYELDKVDDIVFWSIPLHGLLSADDREAYLKLIEME